MPAEDPLYPACPTRLLATVKGVIKHALCTDAAKDQFKQIVQPADCQRCLAGLPIRPEAEAEPTAAAGAPPPEPPGLVRRAASYAGASPGGRPPVGRSDRTRKSSGYSTSSARPATGSTPTSRFVAAAAAGWPKAAMPSKTRSRWPPKTVPETCGETHALQLPRRSTRSTRPAKRLRLPGTLRRPGVEPLSPGGTRHPGRGNGPRAAYGPPGRLAGIPRTPARHPRLPAGRLSPLSRPGRLARCECCESKLWAECCASRASAATPRQSNSALKSRRTSAESCPARS